MNVKFRKILEIAKSDLLNLGVDWGYVSPPMHRLLWKLGIPIRPLICMSNFAILLYLSIAAGIGMIIIGGILTRRFEIVFIGPIFGLFGGIHLTIKIIRERRRINPPSWDEYEKMQDNIENH